jgi:hypothetical protein
MRTTILRVLSCVAASVGVVATAPLSVAIAHGEQQMECTEVSVNAMQADIQAMSDGPLKTTAMKELQTSQAMMGKKDMKGCAEHLHSAMEAMEK